MNDIKIIQILSEPEREFTAVPFWFLNDDLSEETIQCQLRDFAAHGIYGVVLHPRIGLPKRIAYLSDTFFHYIEVAVEAAAKLNMQVVLYDEGMYPSGSAGGKVVEGHPELASYGIALVSAPQPEDEILAETADGVLVARHSGGTLRGIHFGEDDGEPNVPPSADILNPAAVSRFIELTHEQYYARLKPYFGNTIFAMFTDEPSILGRNVRDMFPWTAGFAADFTAAGGNLANLAALFSGEQNEDTRLYEQLILQRESNVYYKRLSEWCEEHGIALMGHPHQSDDIEVERWFHIPGQDLIQRRVAPEGDSVDGMESTMAHCGADAALLMGRRRNANECFGDCNKDKNPWFVTGSDIKWWLDWMAVRGVNLFVPQRMERRMEQKMEWRMETAPAAQRKSSDVRLRETGVRKIAREASNESVQKTERCSGENAGIFSGGGQAGEHPENLSGRTGLHKRRAGAARYTDRSFG